VHTVGEEGEFQFDGDCKSSESIARRLDGFLWLKFVTQSVDVAGDVDVGTGKTGCFVLNAFRDKALVFRILELPSTHVFIGSWNHAPSLLIKSDDSYISTTCPASSTTVSS
jgi:hypothetical protein